MSTQYTTSSPFRIGTRGSPLALAQAFEVRTRLMAAHDLEENCFKIEVINTSGDQIQDRPLSEVGGKGLFTKEIEIALFDDRIDIAVHSAKDVATVLPDGLAMTTFLAREDVRDVFISHNFATIAELPHGATVGSSSIRRRAQLLSQRPDLNVVEFRGNVQTRLKKLRDGVADATFLAAAGLNRLDMADLGKPIPITQALPAPAQGAIGIEHMADNVELATFLHPLHDQDTAICVATERAFLAELDGDCRSPIAAYATIENAQILLRGEVLSLDGRNVSHGQWRSDIGAHLEMARNAAQVLKHEQSIGK